MIETDRGFYFILDKTHNLLVHPANHDFGHEIHLCLPEISPTFSSFLHSSFSQIHYFSEAFRIEIANTSVNLKLILLKGQAKPSISRFQWIPLNQIKEKCFDLTLRSSAHKDSPLICSAQEIQNIYNSQILQGYPLPLGNFEVWHFCNNEADANKLAQLVRQGIKQATASLYDVYLAEEEPLPKIGALSVIIDFDGIPQAIIETTQVEIIPFEDVSENFARIEGEGDKSLEYWRHVHIEFFTEEAEIFHLKFTSKSLVICEQFRVVKLIKT